MPARKLYLILPLILVVCLTAPAQDHRDTMSDTWIATDELNRQTPGKATTGQPRSGKTVGLFYYMWHNETEGLEIHDISKVLAGEQDWGKPGAFHYYCEPLYGYYSSQDEFVIRRQMQMIADAGVDFIFFDVTNRLTYEKTCKKILSVMEKMKGEGYRVPKISFVANSKMDETVEALFRELYGPGIFQDLWFLWEGKPLLMAEYTGENQHIREFFTYKRSWAWTSQQWFTGNGGEDRWPWLDNYPQQPGLKNGKAEYISVATAQHPIGQYAIGKSTGANREEPPQYSHEGTYFSLQWKRALDADPPVIGITQWNEFLAQRFIHPDPRHPVTHMVRKPLKPGESFFVDVYTPEYSRDIEPLRDYYRDNMYLQMVSNIRKFKGARQTEPAGRPKSIRMNGDFSQWHEVRPVFQDDLYDTFHRNHVSYGSKMTYTNLTGRNDLEEMKISCDDRHIFFYARTREPLTPHTGERWMQVLVNSDADYATGWHGYDHILNDKPVSQEHTSIRKYSSGEGTWADPEVVQYQYSGNELHIRVPAKFLGIDTSGPFTFDFKWVDHSLTTGDIMDLYVDGDTAPNSRFNYRFIKE